MIMLYFELVIILSKKVILSNLQFIITNLDERGVYFGPLSQPAAIRERTWQILS